MKKILIFLLAGFFITIFVFFSGCQENSNDSSLNPKVSVLITDNDNIKITLISAGEKYGIPAEGYAVSDVIVLFDNVNLTIPSAWTINEEFYITLDTESVYAISSGPKDQSPIPAGVYHLTIKIYEVEIYDEDLIIEMGF